MEGTLWPRKSKDTPHHSHRMSTCRSSFTVLKPFFFPFKKLLFGTSIEYNEAIFEIE